jgi:hypothetical protein
VNTEKSLFSWSAQVLHSCNPNYWKGGHRRIASSRAARSKFVRPYLKNKTKTKGVGACLKWQSTCFICERPCVQTPVPQEKKKKREREKEREEGERETDRQTISDLKHTGLTEWFPFIQQPLSEHPHRTGHKNMPSLF